MLTMVCAKALSKGNKACSCVRSVNKVASEAMIQERTYLSRIGRSSLRSRTKQDQGYLGLLELSSTRN